MTEFALTLCQIQVTIARTAQERDEAEADEGDGVIPQAKEPERSRAHFPEPGLLWRTLMEGRMVVRKVPSGWGHYQHLGQKRTFPHSPSTWSPSWRLRRSHICSLVVHPWAHFQRGLWGQAGLALSKDFRLRSSSSGAAGPCLCPPG